ncbi:MAG: quinolinate synthase, partial [Pseudomonadota bacterium]
HICEEPASAAPDPEASEPDQRVWILTCGNAKYRVHLIPDMEAGCSLAASITAADIRVLREAYPNVPIVTYVNTSAEVKAESDICCTSGNAVRIVESLDVPRVIVLPDEYLANYVASQTDVEIITWQGRCEVHERFDGEEIERYRNSIDGLVVVAHPECPPDVIKVADFAGSTAQMINYVKEQRPSRVLLLTECSMSDNIAAETPEVEFMRPCGLCPHMKRISLPKIRHALETMQPEVTIDPAVAQRARLVVERMLAVT